MAGTEIAINVKKMILGYGQLLYLRKKMMNYQYSMEANSSAVLQLIKVPELIEFQLGPNMLYRIKLIYMMQSSGIHLKVTNGKVKDHQSSRVSEYMKRM